uniref:hypothetical protein n=1 Tax=Flavobacterium sp. TaxID=239 RepID=UPI00404A7DF5
MKRLTLVISLTIWTISLFAQNPTENLNSLTTVLTGVWEIEKVIDKDGNEVEYITREMKDSPLGNEIQIKATGPKIILNEDGSYELEFTPKNTDKGKWFLESSTTLIFQLVTKKGSGSYNMLKSAAEMFGKTLKYDEDGNIVENNKQEITKLKSDELLIRYETDYYQVYKKKK